MHEPDPSPKVHDDLGRHTSQLKKVNLLTVAFEDLMFRVRQPHKGQSILLPVSFEGRRPLRSDHDDVTAIGCKAIIFIAQLRHVPPAKRSDKAPIEDQHYMALVTVIGQSYPATGKIGQFKIRGRRIDLYFLGHDTP